MNAYAADQDRQFTRATERVNNDPDLNQYRDILLESDWPEPEHYAWVASENKADLLDWCDTIRRGLDQLEPETER